MKKHFSVLVGIFPKLPDVNDDYNEDVYYNLIEEIKGTELENETTFKEWKERNQNFLG